MDAVPAAVHEKISPFDCASGFSFEAEAAKFFPAGAFSILWRGYFNNRLLRFSAESGRRKNCEPRAGPRDVSRFSRTRGHARRRDRSAQISKIDNPRAGRRANRLDPRLYVLRYERRRFLDRAGPGTAEFSHRDGRLRARI